MRQRRHIRVEAPRNLSKACSVEGVDGGRCHGDLAAIVIAVGSLSHTTSVTLCEYHRQELRYAIGCYGIGKDPNEKGNDHE